MSSSRERCAMRNLSRTLAMLVVAAASTQTTAGIVSIDFVAPLSSAQFIVAAADDQQLALSVGGPSFVVNDGDTVRVRWTFSNSQIFQLMPDPHIGLQGWLLLSDPSTPTYSAEFAVAWSLLDAGGGTILSGSEGRQTHAGGDLHSGGLTVALANAVEVGGLLMELSDLAVSGSTSLEFSGASLLVHNAAFGAPFVPVPPPGGTTPEPGSILLVLAAIAGLAAAHGRRVRVS